MFDYYHIVDVGWAQYIITSEYKERKFLLEFLEQYPDARVCIMSNNHRVMYQWQPLRDILGRSKPKTEYSNQF